MINKTRILLIGSLPPPYGGTTVSFKHLFEILHTNKSFNVQVLDTIGIRGDLINGFGKLIVLLFKLIRNIRKSDIISMHLNDLPFAYLGVVILVLSKIYKKPLIVRKFGGNSFQLGFIGNYAAFLVMKHSDIVLLQTKSLVRQAQNRGLKNIRWYATSRPRPKSQTNTKTEINKGCSKFVYIGHVKKEKGILELLEASERFSQNINVDVYGPFSTDLDLRCFSNSKTVNYCGILCPEDVITTLQRYDAFVFPTYNRKEGYSGAIIEAYFAGLPVICTDWQALPEIVDENTGILVPPKNSEALYQAMKKMCEDVNLYVKLRKGALERSIQFDSEFWANEFGKYCLELQMK